MSGTSHVFRMKFTAYAGHGPGIRNQQKKVKKHAYKGCSTRQKEHFSVKNTRNVLKPALPSRLAGRVLV